MAQDSAPGRPAMPTLAGHAERRLREMIFSGELAPGVRISAAEAAEQFGISAVPVREALYALASRGLVEAIPRRGFRVPPADPEDFQDTYQLRILLDPYAVRLAVPRMTPAALSEMDRALEALAVTIRSGDIDSYDTDHRAFHFAISDYSGSRWLTTFQQMLFENSLRYQRLSAGLRGSAEQRIREHQAIADACHRGDADGAAEVVRRHLEHTSSVVYEALSADSQTEADGQAREAG